MAACPATRWMLLTWWAALLVAPDALAQRLPVATDEVDPGTQRQAPRPDPAGPSAQGQRGLYRTWAAMPYEPLTAVVGWHLEFFKSSDFLADGDDNKRLKTLFSLAVVPIGGLEINAGLSISANHNAAFEPGLTQTMGDPTLGLRYGYAVNDWLALGAGVLVLVPSGNGVVELALEGTSTRILTAVELRPLPEILVALNLGYHFDNSSRVFDHPLNEAQRFSSGSNPHDQLQVHLGAAWQLGPVAPFLELGTAQAMGADGLGFGDNPMWLTLGVRGWIFSHHSLHLLAAVDIGLAGIHPPADKARIPPYNAIFGVAFDFGARPQSQPVIRVREVERVKEVIKEVPATPPPPKPLGRVAGQVVDAQTNKPLAGARVTVHGEQPVYLMTGPEDGRFVSCAMDPGPVKLSVALDGYRQKTEAVMVTDQPETPVTVALAPATGVTYGRLKGTVRSAQGKPLRALIAIPARKVKRRAKKGTGAFELKLRTGVFDVLFSMPGYVTQRRKIRLRTGDLVIINVELYPKK